MSPYGLNQYTIYTVLHQLYVRCELIWLFSMDFAINIIVNQKYFKLGQLFLSQDQFNQKPSNTLLSNSWFFTSLWTIFLTQIKVLLHIWQEIRSYHCPPWYVLLGISAAFDTLENNVIYHLLQSIDFTEKS